MLKEVLAEIRQAAIACGRDPESVGLVAVSKGRSVAEILALYKQGQRVFGESRLQEVEKKRAELPSDISWHLIGTLQKKKVPKVIGRFSLIHSVDSLELAQKLSSASMQRGFVTSVLLQVNASVEPTKHGFSFDGLKEAFPALCTLPGISLHGLMAMGPRTDDVAAISSSFQRTADLFHSLQDSYSLSHFKQLSMGMSSDFKLAIDAGATLVRIGTRLFM